MLKPIPTNKKVNKNVNKCSYIIKQNIPLLETFTRSNFKFKAGTPLYSPSDCISRSFMIKTRTSHAGITEKSSIELVDSFFLAGRPRHFRC